MSGEYMKPTHIHQWPSSYNTLLHTCKHATFIAFCRPSDDASSNPLQKKNLRPHEKTDAITDNYQKQNDVTWIL